MRLSLRHLREGAIIAGIGVLALLAIVAIDEWTAPGNPFRPGLMSGVIMAAMIAVLRRYGRQGDPVDPRRRRIELFSAMAASVGLLAIAVVAAVWLEQSQRRPIASCPGESSLVAPSDERAADGLCVSPNRPI